MTVTERKEENQTIEKLMKMMTSVLPRPEFLPGGVPVAVAAEVYGKHPCFVQEGIRAGWLPIGHMKPGDQRDNFYISPLKLWEDTGFLYTGQSAEEVRAVKQQIRQRRWEGGN